MMSDAFGDLGYFGEKWKDAMRDLIIGMKLVVLQEKELSLKVQENQVKVLP